MNGCHPGLAGDARAVAYLARSAHGHAAAVEDGITVHATHDAAKRRAHPGAAPSNCGIVNDKCRARSVAATQRAHKAAGSFSFASTGALNANVVHGERAGACIVAVDLGSARVLDAADDAAVDDAAAVLGQRAIEGSGGAAVGRALEGDVAVGDVEVTKDGAGVGLAFEFHGAGGHNLAVAREGLLAGKADAADKTAGVLAIGRTDS